MVSQASQATACGQFRPGTSLTAHINASMAVMDMLLKSCCELQGKTTLCQCLLAVPGSDLKLHDGTATSHQQFLDDSDSLCTTVTWEDTADKVRWIYKVQDTPGTLSHCKSLTTLQHPTPPT